jgi:hypothetical protein
MACCLLLNHYNDMITHTAVYHWQGSGAHIIIRK